MTDEDLLEIMAGLTGQNKEDIKNLVDIHKRSAISRIFSKTKPFWIKNSGVLSISSGDKTVDLRDSFPDIWQLRYLYNSVGRLDFVPDEEFRNQFGLNNSANGKPDRYTTLSNYEIELYPVADSAVTLYAAYFYKPSLQTISSLPEEWQFVAQDYIQAMLLPKTYDLTVFLDGLKDLINMARPTIEQDFEFESNDSQLIVNNSAFNLSRSK
jgi:hypothetical protein